jgi:acyl-CoA thioester hydrolase
MLKKNSDQFTYRIYYEDTDAIGVVYYANYLKFFERARTDFLRSLNISQQQLAKENQIVFVVKKCNIEYLSPAKLDDLINVSVKISEIKKISLLMHQTISVSNKIISVLEVEIVCLDSNNFKPTKIPQHLIDLIYV